MGRASCETGPPGAEPRESGVSGLQPAEKERMAQHATRHDAPADYLGALPDAQREVLAAGYADGVVLFLPQSQQGDRDVDDTIEAADLLHYDLVGGRVLLRDRRRIAGYDCVRLRQRGEVR